MHVFLYPWGHHKSLKDLLFAESILVYSCLFLSLSVAVLVCLGQSLSSWSVLVVMVILVCPFLSLPKIECSVEELNCDKKLENSFLNVATLSNIGPWRKTRPICVCLYLVYYCLVISCHFLSFLVLRNQLADRYFSLQTCFYNTCSQLTAGCYKMQEVEFINIM
jgi:hypothetical protein